MKKSLGSGTLAMPAPIWAIGTYDENNKPNAMAAAWGGICCSDPVCVTVSLREATYSYNNILNRKAFTVNIPSEEMIKQTDYFGLVSGRDTDKFADTSLTATKSELVDAPYIEQFPLVIECKLFKHTVLGLHTQFVGKVVDVKADQEMLDEKGKPDITKIKPPVFSTGNRSYYSIGELIGPGFSIGKNPR